MSHPMTLFVTQVTEHLAQIIALCEAWHLPQLGEHLTLVLRDPDDPARSIIMGTDQLLDAVVAAIRYLEAEHAPDFSTDAYEGPDNA